MHHNSTFQIYNASAGSGKTFTLVKEYLKILLISDDLFIFQKILAVTFTNKAAAEMKQRVLKSLQEFSEGKQTPIFLILQEETALEANEIEKKSKKILYLILQNYAAFHITTIDSFTHKIIKSFAFDLGLSQNFEVEMNATDLLDKAVEVLISRIGVDKKLTQILIEYALDKSDDDKSWDISRDLAEFSKILLNEEDTAHFRKLSDKSLEDFKSLQKKLIFIQKELITKMKSTGEEALQIINSRQLISKDFYRSMLPNHFTSLLKKPEATKFFEQSNLKKRVEEGALYLESKPQDIKSSIEEILPELLKLYANSEVLYQQLIQTKLVLKNIIPLAVLNNINQELNQIKEDNNIRLNAEFNQLISDNIQDQPAPFIYERIGQKFMHFFIDEMQDTSVLQWENLIPLIGNSLAQENTSLLLVGDAKQAIYRWRGGKASQFIELGLQNKGATNPFLIEKKIKELLVNYRSYSEIIKFNNSFFKHVSQFLQNTSYSNLFLNNSHQKENELKGGSVSISFLEKLENKEDNELKYAKRVHQIIKNLPPETSLGAVCVLVRKRSEGVVVANYLSENDVAIVSSETLLLSTSEKVNFIINFLKYTLQSNDKESLLEILYFLHKHLNISVERHAFFASFINLELQEVLELLKKYNCNFDVISFHQSPLYEKIEQIIRSFYLQNTTDAYVQFFLDEVLAKQIKEASIQDFLDFWEHKKASLSIVTSENPNAIKIMTIHKSKGLEFPIVIFPCDLNIYQDINPKVWLENHDDDFPNMMVSLNKEIQYVNEQGKEMFNQWRTALELDSFNLLYVALTRAAEKLYIITEKKLLRSGLEDFNYYSGIFISFLKDNNLWDENESEYVFGDITQKVMGYAEETPSQIQETFISTPWKNHQIKLLANSSTFWGSSRGEAKQYGTFIHKVLSEIITKDDIKSVLHKYVQQGDLTLQEKKEIEESILKIVTHPELQQYYSKDITVYNEREIVFNHQIVIPDRLVIDQENKLTILDYKTGSAKEEHRFQLEKYANVLESLQYTVHKKILIYSNETVFIEEF